MQHDFPAKLNAPRMFRPGLTIYCVTVAMLSLVAEPVYAYVGPGAGLTAIGSVLALIAAIFLSIVGFVWYPVKRLLRKRARVRADLSKTGDDASTDEAEQEEPITQRRET